MPVRINRALRRAVCFFFEHIKADMSIGTVSIRLCTRWLRITDQRTIRRQVTRGEIEQRRKDHAPEGYSFVSLNWKKRKGRFMSPSDSLKFVTL